MAPSARRVRGIAMVKNFRFVEPGALALSGAPQSAEDVDWLYDQGIRTVVSLHPVPPEAQARMEERGIAWRPALTADFAEEAPEGFGEALAFLVERSAEAPASCTARAAAAGGPEPDTRPIWCRG